MGLPVSQLSLPISHIEGMLGSQTLQGLITRQLVLGSPTSTRLPAEVAAAAAPCPQGLAPKACSSVPGSGPVYPPPRAGGTSARAVLPHQWRFATTCKARRRFCPRRSHDSAELENVAPALQRFGRALQQKTQRLSGCGMHGIIVSGSNLSHSLLDSCQNDQMLKRCWQAVYRVRTLTLSKRTVAWYQTDVPPLLIRQIPRETFCRR